jgi:thiopeptide-type bacteriocin biosynthesis protein
MRYLLRAEQRPTPFGFFAGITPAAFAARTAVRWGEEPVAIAQPSAAWLARLIDCLERRPEVLAGLKVVANTTAFARGDRLIVPHQPAPDGGPAAVMEVSIRNTSAVRAAMDQARSPVRCADLAATLHDQFPGTSEATVTGMLAELVGHRALITGLHAPATVPDPLAHVIGRLGCSDLASVAGVAELTERMKRIHDRLGEHNQQPARHGRHARQALVVDMAAILPSSTPDSARPAGRSRPGRAGDRPLTVDLRLDATVTLPQTVAVEIARAGDLLTRLSAFPFGSRAWSGYTQRFWERYGIGSLIPVSDVIADLGYPDGFTHGDRPLRRPAISARDELLVALAQTAALDGREEVALDEATLADLKVSGGAPHPPPHLELGMRIHAVTAQALDAGDFLLEVVHASRGAGTLIGRFLPLISSTGPHPANGNAGGCRLAELFNELPAGDAETMPVQLSFSPLHPRDGHLCRTVQVLPTVISLAEHRMPDDSVLTPADLAVGCDGHRLYLAAPALGRRVEPVAANALNPHAHTPPLARFLLELGRAQATQVTPFDWGPAARRLPYQPRLRCGRIVISAAQWRLTAIELPGRASSWPDWDTALAVWRERRALPQRVLLADGGRQLALHMDEPGHRWLLRSHVETAGHARLLEAPSREAAGWCGGRSHELIAVVTTTRPSTWPPLPRPAPARLAARDGGHVPGITGSLLAKLYAPVAAHDVLLAEHLPALIETLGLPPWWFLRFDGSEGPHLRLRIGLPLESAGTVDPAAYGRTVAVISTWATSLHRAGLARHIHYASFVPEVGRWGSGPAYRLAERVFAADSRSVCAQLRVADRPDRIALAAAHIVAIATAFTGNAAAGMRWLIDHMPVPAPATPIARPLFTQAVRLADPEDDWAALRAAPGGEQIAAGWPDRDAAVAAYRAVLPDVECGTGDCAGIIPGQVLTSLIHAHVIRAIGIDRAAEAAAGHLARSAALAWRATHAKDSNA